MNEMLKEAGIDIPAMSKHWDSQRTYDKRLVTLMSKDAGIKVTARKTVKTRTEATERAGTADGGDEAENDGSQLPGRGRPKAKPSANASQSKKAKEGPMKAVKESRPQALPTRRSNRAVAQENASKYAEESSDAGEEEEENDQDGQDEDRAVLPCRRANGVNGAAAKSKRLPSPSEDESESDQEVEQVRASAGTSLPARRGPPKEASKRPREAGPEDEEAPLPPPLASRNGNARSTTTPSLPADDLTLTPASSVRGASPEAVMSLSTQELRETESFAFDLPDSPPPLDSQSDGGEDRPLKKRSRY